MTRNEGQLAYPSTSFSWPGNRKERSSRWPEILPGGAAVLFTLATSDIQSFDDARVVVRSLKNGTPALRARSALMSVPFDPVRLLIAGTSRPVVDGVVTYAFSGAAQHAATETGALVYIAGRPISQQATLTWVDRARKASPLAAPPAAYQGAKVAPDGRVELGRGA